MLGLYMASGSWAKLEKVNSVNKVNKVQRTKYFGTDLFALVIIVNWFIG